MNQGELTVYLKLENGEFNAKIIDAEGNIKKLGASATKESSKVEAMGSAFDSVAGALGGVLKSGLAVLAGGSFGLGVAAKAAWDQVDAVQQAKAGLDRYYSSASDVNGIMKSLVGYAQSDAGVLFNRKDLFNSAQGLAMYNIEASKVSGYVQILSRGMASNRITWDDMDRVIGRVIATSKLGGEEFEMLRKAGYNLDSSLRNASMGADELFTHLDNSIAKDVSQDLTNITPIGIRLDSALRGIGNAFLGVNDMGDKFVKGGVGYSINQIFSEMTTFLKTPELKTGIANLGKQFGEFATAAVPVIKGTFLWLVNNMDTLVAGLGAFIGAFVFAKVASFSIALTSFVLNLGVMLKVIKSTTVAAWGFNAAIAANPIGIIVGIIVAVVAALIFLQVKFNIFGKAWDFIKSVWGGAVKWFSNVWTGIQEVFSGVGQWFKDSFDKALKSVMDIGRGIKDFFTGIGKGLSDVFTPIAKSASDVAKSITGFFSGVFAWFGEYWQEILAIMFLPFSIALGLIIANWSTISTFFQGIWNGIVAVFTPVAEWFGMIFGLAWQGVVIYWNTAVAFYVGIWNGIKAVFSVAVSWFTTIFSLAWQGVVIYWNVAVGFFTGIWNGIVATYSGVASWFGGVFGAAWNGIVGIFSGVGGFFRGVWSTIVSIFTPIGTAVGNAIGGSVRTVVNSILGFAENSINGFIRAINVAIATINNIPGVKIGNIGLLNIPRFATGGIVPATAGGRQVVVAEGGQDEWIVPDSKMASLVSQVLDRLSYRDRDSDYDHTSESIWKDRDSSRSAPSQVIQQVYPSNPVDMDIVYDDFNRALRRR